MTSSFDTKYCRCIKKLLYSQVDSPYAICTKSVYQSRGLKRGKVDCKQYDKMDTVALRALARRKGVLLTTDGRYKRKAELIKDIKSKGYVTKNKNK